MPNKKGKFVLLERTDRNNAQPVGIVITTLTALVENIKGFEGTIQVGKIVFIDSATTLTPTSPTQTVGTIVKDGRWFVRLRNNGDLFFAEINPPVCEKRKPRKCQNCGKGGELLDTYPDGKRVVLCGRCDQPDESDGEAGDGEAGDDGEGDGEAGEDGEGDGEAELKKKAPAAKARTKPAAKAAKARTKPAAKARIKRKPEAESEEDSDSEPDSDTEPNRGYMVFKPVRFLKKSNYYEPFTKRLVEGVVENPKTRKELREKRAMFF